MKKIDINTWNRRNTYNWFKTFTNTTYSMNVRMDITSLVKHVKKRNESFFIDFLYIIVKGLNCIEEMKMRLVNDEVVIYDNYNPAFTVLSKTGTFENVRFEGRDSFKEFYDVAHKYIEEAKEQTEIVTKNYNPNNCYNEYYITCTPWVDFESVSHPIPDDKSSQSIPRVCFGKYCEVNGKYEITLNITVSHLFVDGYELCSAFNEIQELLDNCVEVLK